MSKTTKFTYASGSKMKAVIRNLLDTTGKGVGRNGKSSDYNYIRNVAQFGNEHGYITLGQKALLGRIYNRVQKELGTRKSSWRNLG